MDFSNFHLIRKENKNIVYHTLSMDIISLGDLPFHILSLLKEGTPIQSIIDKYKAYEDTIYSFISSLEDIDKTIKNGETNSDNKRNIHRITLHVANDCNLRCKYCYAGGGNYKQYRKLMTIQTADAFVDFCESNFDEIKNIVFFGGEPLLNINILEYICDRFKKDHSIGKCRFIPQFNIITNGTLLNDRIIQFIKENISIMTVSIDGKQQINDMNRVYANGNGSYAKIAEFIHTMREKTSVNIGFESTYTQSHIDSGYKVKDVYEDLEKEFGIYGYVFPEDSFDINYSLKYLQSQEYKDPSKVDFRDFPADFWLILQTIVQKKELEFCPIVNKIFAVSAEGVIYPCHMQNGMNDCSLGNINGVNIFNDTSLYNSFMSILKMKNNNKCQSCWVRNLCGGCTYRRFYNQDKKCFQDKPLEDYCELTKQFIEQVISMIVLIRNNPPVWNILLEKAHRQWLF